MSDQVSVQQPVEPLIQAVQSQAAEPSYTSLNSEAAIKKAIDSYLRKQNRLDRRKHHDSLKESFEVIDEFELAELAQVDVKTVRQWRTRRIGPMYISAGKARLYFKKDVLAWMKSIRKETSTFDLGVLAGEA